MITEFFRFLKFLFYSFTSIIMSFRVIINLYFYIAGTGVAIDIMVKNMRRHFSHQSMQRQGCLAIRNIAARSPEVRSQLLDAGVEDVLRVRN